VLPEFNLRTANKVSVTTVTFDAYAAGHPIPDLIKMDVENAELLVLEGSRHVLRDHAPLWVIELIRAGSARTRSEHVLAFMRANGYESYVISAEGALRREEVTLEGMPEENIVFKKAA
jgi:hypothetical protein